ncbi:PP2C family protein-serine/threonine phosphatase [Roseovarius nanhaiticus]|uniref:PP2C family protein-serine/threonine phosphatase n=1 Tax=Roseovarius nanhaiticus TaxID=573024 RepID=UPI0024917D55|nr:protein phosphatase 2C domain-containing protein [Roseovarius nanhaiticus]
MEHSFVQRKLYNWLRRDTGSSAVRKVASLRGAIASEIGNVRSDNQDKAIAFKGVDAQGHEYAVAVVADGIGGMNDGAACAALAIASFTSAICAQSQAGSSSPWVRMKQAANSANEAVYRDYLGRGGSTLVAVLFLSDTPPIWVSAGDSRIYLQSGKSLKLLTTDDTIAGQLNKSGTVPAEHSKILQFVGMGKDFEPHVSDVREAQEGNLILTTDGVHYLENGSDWFKNIIQNAPDAGTTAKRLVEVARWCGGPDNATLACVGFPFRPSDRQAVGDGIQIWDAFGELDIQLHPNTTSNRHQAPSKMPDSVADDVEAQLTEEEEPELLPPTGKTSGKAAPKKPRKSRAKKSEDQDPPQLDIEFSKKE